MLGDLQRWEEALRVTEEAVAIYRTLAAARPEGFNPSLAMALNNLVGILGKLGRHEEALTAATEAVTVLTPAFLADYDTFAEWMARLLRKYAEQCRDLEREPDTQAFEPILEQFRSHGVDSVSES
jgi:tetratricopeptide (TPR) repeat protein